MTDPLSRVVITGIGVVSAAGIGIESTWQTIQSDRPNPSAVSVPGPANICSDFLAFVAPDYAIGEVTKTLMSGAQLEREGLEGSRDLKHLIAAVGMALEDSDIQAGADGFERLGMVIADEHPGIEQLSRRLYQGIAVGQAEVLSEKIFELNSFLVPYRVARAFGIGGECIHVNSACTSGLNAMDFAAVQVRLGRTPIALAAGSDDPLSSGKFEWFAQRNLYDTGGRLKPFSDEAGGTVFGDGGAALVFEERNHAIERGARIYAEYLGAGFTQDGWRVNAPHPQRANQARAMRQAMTEAKVDPSNISVVVPHGTGIRPTDQYERRNISEVWPEQVERPICLALKPFVGHNLGGASILEAAILAKAISEQKLPRAIPTKFSNQDIVFCETYDWVHTEIKLAIKASAAFAGYYGAVVLGQNDLRMN